MWRLKKISAKNFMSFRELEYSFEGKCYVVNGRNVDNDGQLSNGSGKSSFIDLIGVSILGYTLSGRNAKSCVNWQSEDSFMNVDCVLENAEHNMTCEISRKIYSNTRSSELVILVNGEVPPIPTKKGVKDGVDIKAGEEYILKSILDIKADDLLNYYLISGKYYEPYLKINTEKKLEVISRFTNITAVDKATIELEMSLKKILSSIAMNKEEIQRAEGYIQALSESLSEEAEQTFNASKEASIASKESGIKDIEAKLISLMDEEEVATEKEGELKKLLIEIDVEAKNELETLKKSIDYKPLIEKEKSLNKRRAHINNFLAGLIKCPDCGSEFNLEFNETMTTKDLVDVEDQISELVIEIATMKDYENEISEMIEGIVSQERSNRNTQSLIDANKRNIDSITNTQKRLIEEMERLEFEKANVAASTFADERANIDFQINQKKKEIEQIEGRIVGLEAESATASKWIANFQDFKFFLGNKPLQIITGLVNQYLEFNGSDLNLHIDGFKKLKNGELRQSLNPVIYRNWSDPHEYEAFSEGEKTRLNISVDLAFQQLINNASALGGLDLYVSDELLSSLDSMGVKAAAEAFNDLGKTIVLVTHSAADMNFPNSITVEKEKGISRII